MVDTGATFTVLPVETLRDVGASLQPVRKKLELGDGRFVDAATYSVVLAIQDREDVTFAVAFSGAKPVLGVRTLEDLGSRSIPWPEPWSRHGPQAQHSTIRSSENSTHSQNIRRGGRSSTVPPTDRLERDGCKAFVGITFARLERLNILCATCPMMGLTRVQATVTNPAFPDRKLPVDLIVDTGSVLTWVHEENLVKIGVKPKRQKEFRTIEGRTVRRPTGAIVISLDGAEGDVEVVFAEKGDAEVLGVTALEGLGYEVDPVTRTLHRSSLLAL